MEKTLNEKAEKIKKNINGISEKSKEVIREMIISNSRYASEAINSNAKVFEDIKKNLKHQEVEDTITDNLKHSLVKSMELAEDTLDAIINSYTRQMELTVDFNSKLVDLVKDGSPENADKFLDLIHKNFESNRELTAKNTKEILEFYNKHTNLAINFNKKFADNVNAQIETLFQMQNKSLGRFTDWASQWWKQSQSENVKA